MNPLNYKTHPIILATILALFIALCNYIMLEFVFDYSNLIFGTDINIPPNDIPQPHQLNPTQQPHHHHSYLSFVINQIVAIFLLSFILYISNFYIYIKKQILKKQIITSTLATITLTTIFCFSSITINYHAHSLFGQHLAGPRLHDLINSSITRDSSIAFFTFLTSLLFYYIQRQEQIRLSHKSLIAENIQSKYNALAAQLDPHFLFNSLNTLKALIKSNPDMAQNYTQQLSDIFRFTTKHNDIVSLNEEIEFSQTYANMMLMRYENNLRIIYNVNRTYLDYQVLPFAIQTLIENAIKHNTITTKTPLTIEIYSDDTAHILVRNRKNPKKTQEPTNGLGLKNLNDRYRYQFNTQIEISNTTEYFSVRIPLIKPH